ncbi:hypothetical protein [Mucilaginibacter flavus]|uniref:hypothetical protein n=1 Tax=Mucilaginibacter flavus TaxID=931504 RepID=UPI0025B36265|nr:hypothetical protein [Mucilaginibacter flavus]
MRLKPDLLVGCPLAKANGNDFDLYILNQIHYLRPNYEMYYPSLTKGGDLNKKRRVNLIAFLIENHF